MTAAPENARFSTLLLEGLDHYRKGKMREAVRAWEAAYELEPTNLRAREFLHSALQRIHAQMSGEPAAGDKTEPVQVAPAHPEPATPSTGAAAGDEAAAGKQAAAGKAASGGADRQGRAGQVPAGSIAVGRVSPAQAGFGRAPAAAAGGAAAAAVAGGRPTAGAGGHPWLPSSRPGAAKKPARPDSPWDEGPSRALPQGPEPTDEANASAWSIHAEAPPAPPSEDEEIEILLSGARELLALNDFSGARDLTAKILERRKGDADAEAIHRVCEENLTQMYESSLGSLHRKPRVSLKPDEIIWLNLDPRAGFVLAQIDGEVSFEDLYAICGLSQLDTARILSQLLSEGVVSIQDDLPRP